MTPIPGDSPDYIDPRLKQPGRISKDLPGYNVPDPELKTTQPGETDRTPATPETTKVPDPVLHTIPEPDEAQFWKVGDKYYIVYMVPGFDPPIPMAWETDLEELQTIAGPDQRVIITQTIDQASADAQGMTVWGKATELDPAEHPFDAYIALINDQAAVRPWLRDLEVLELIAQATLEGRQVSDAEYQQTEWYRSRNDRERKWLLLYESDPKTAETRLENAKFQAEDDLMSAGINDVPPELIDYISRQLVIGGWSAEYYDRQLKAISDPNLGYTIDQDLIDALGGSINVGTNQQYEDTVRALAERWLGPVMGNMTDADIARWASKYRESADGPAELVEELRRQRLALFPEYEDETLTYEDIAMPWRAKWQQMWGETANELDPLFNQIIRANNVTEAGKLLTRAGLDRGVRKVEQDTQSAMDRAFRSSAGVVSLR